MSRSSEAFLYYFVSYLFNTSWEPVIDLDPGETVASKTAMVSALFELPFRGCKLRKQHEHQ